MSEQTAPENPSFPYAAWTRSPLFRSFLCNHFQYRVGTGDVALLLGMVTSEATQQGLPVVQQEAEVFFTWPQLRNLAKTLAAVVETIEAEVGEIPLSPTEAQVEASRSALLAHVRTVIPR